MKDKNEKLIELTTIKRSGQHVPFDGTKIALAIKKCFDSTNFEHSSLDVNSVYDAVISEIQKSYGDRKTINVEDIQDIIEDKLVEKNFTEVQTVFHDYRERRAISRQNSEAKNEHKFLKTVERLSNVLSSSSDKLPFSSLLSLGTIVSREYASSYVIDNKFVRAHSDGIIYIDNIDYLATGAVKEFSFTALNLASSENLFTDLAYYLVGLSSEVKDKVTVLDFEDAVNLYIEHNLKKEFVIELQSLLENEGILPLVDFGRIMKKVNSSFDFFENDPDFTSCEAVRRSMNSVKKNASSVVKKKVISDINSMCFMVQYMNLGFDAKFVFEMTSGYLKDAMKDFNRISFVDENPKICNKKESAESCEYKILVADVAINMPRIALESENKQDFILRFEDALDLAKGELTDSFNFLGNRLKKSYKYLFDETLTTECSKLEDDSRIRKILRQGKLNISLIGLKEASLYMKTDNKFIKEILILADKDADEYTSTERIKFTISEDKAPPGNAAKYFADIDKAIFGKTVMVAFYHNSEYNKSTLEGGDR